MLPEIKSPVANWLWDPRWNADAGFVPRVVRVLRYAYALFRDLGSGEITLRAMSLVYTTLLSIVPLTALSFSLLKGFGAHRDFQPILVNMLEPLGHENAERVAQQLIDTVDGISGAPLAGVGLLLVFYTAVSMLQKIEASFNYLWEVDQARSFARRFSEYISVLVVGPALMVLAIGLTASVTSHRLVQRFTSIEPFGQGIVLAGKLTPYVVVIIVFTFLYILFPNTRVKFRSALVGGIAAGVMWAAMSAFFASFIASSATRTAMYAGFAIGIVVLIWLYLNWLILLTGSRLSFYVQNPEHLLTGREDVNLPNQARELLALGVMRMVGIDFLEGREGRQINDVAPELGLPSSLLGFVFERLREDGLLKITEDQRLLPGRALESIRLRDVVGSVRHYGHRAAMIRTEPLDAVRPIAATVDAAVGEVLGERTLRDLLRDEAAASSKATE